MEAYLKQYTAFDGFQRIACGPLSDVARAVKNATESAPNGLVLIFDDVTGKAIDIDTRGTMEEVEARHAAPPAGRGRPRLGVIAREVTLLPRHWDWLSTQPGGASVALRKLVEEARRTSGAKGRRRAAEAAAYHFMSAMAGDLPGFEEAARSLFAGDRRRFGELIAPWPPDVRDHAIKLAFADLDPSA